ncbi:MAG: hypothetical protein GYB68_15655 [Chloroflexi bacterium]|nr:hypothetical protein [Chloroflexota bacterium]
MVDPSRRLGFAYSNGDLHIQTIDPSSGRPVFLAKAQLALASLGPNIDLLISPEGRTLLAGGSDHRLALVGAE